MPINDMIGDAWRGCIGMFGSTLAVMSAFHEELDIWLRTMGLIVGLAASSLALYSLILRVIETHRKK